MASETSPINRHRVMVKKYFKAYKSSRCCAQGSSYIIKAADDTYEKFYVLFTPQSSLYKSQEHILLIETMYNGGHKYYPKYCPNIKFVTAIYHTNISSDGDVCVDFLTDSSKWSSIMELDAIISSIDLLLDQPNVDSPYNCDASNDYKKYTKTYKEAAAELESKGAVDEKSLSDLRESVFAPLKQFSDDYTEQNKSIIYKFRRYFPSLDNSAHTYDADSDYAELTAKYERLFGAADKKAEEPSAAPAGAPAVDETQKKLALLARLKKAKK